ncbi:MAG: Hsp20/alpha crystallin family protein [Candidatus Aminicenantes bacterium]|nr:Hsp20/alpha crystallin family protein [Candidatus Aminicenantes bacterium]
MVKKIRPVAKIFKTETEIRGLGREIVIKRESWGTFDYYWEPAVDVYEKDQEVVVEVEVPGVAAEDLKIVQYGNRLEISGFKKEMIKAEKIKFHRLEREMGLFSKEIILPAPVSTEKTTAVLENGILKICLKKLKSVNKEIEVKIKKNSEESGGGK